MIDGRSVLAIVAARGGSKGLPGKNLRILGGKPLIAWSIEAARGSRYVDRVVVSSDDDAIMAAARARGAEAPFARPAALATDTAAVEDAIIHCLDALDRSYDFLVLLQPTSPLRIAADIDGGIETCVRAGAPACISVTEASKSPYWMFTLDEAGRMTPILRRDHEPRRRQDLPVFHQLNGAVYVAEVSWFRVHRRFLAAETRAYVMPKERSVDVDDAVDFALARVLLEGAAGA